MAHHPLRPVRLTLHLEGIGVMATCIYLYAHLGGSWPLFAALLLVPDVMMMGYLAGPKVGAALYNLAHSYLGPLALAGASAALGAPDLILIALIWGAHIGMDRALGYGLKYASGFKGTHIARA